MFQYAWPDMAGCYRRVEVDAFAPIGDLPPHPDDVPGCMHRFGEDLAVRTSAAPADAAAAVELARWTHMELVRIHPFQEGNGKTARLAMNVIIMRHVTGPTLPLDIPPGFRERYMTCVQEARQERPDAFEDLIADLLEQTVERLERLPSIVPIWRRIRWRRRRPLV
jgi:hypothetical protein